MPNPRLKPRHEKPDDGGKRVTFASFHWSLQWLVLFDGSLVGNCLVQLLFERRVDWSVNFIKAFVYATNFLGLCYAYVYWQAQQSTSQKRESGTKS